ncbi:type II toxin-antitoxin system antitoxin SocA domain-containing protein [Capnocytophaga leadbetteri]
MNENLTKITAFEYIVYKLKEWYEEMNPNKKELGENDLSILKVMKLLFFVSGVDIANNLFDIFDRFQAWQYGHVEADLYNQYSQKKGNFNYLEISRERTVLKEKAFTMLNESNYLSKELKLKIDDDIEKLKEKNKELINYPAFELVNLSHAYHSWDIYYNKLKKPYTDMDKSIIINEPKYYQ